MRWCKGRCIKHLSLESELKRIVILKRIQIVFFFWKCQSCLTWLSIESMTVWVFMEYYISFLLLKCIQFRSWTSNKLMLQRTAYDSLFCHYSKLLFKYLNTIWPSKTSWILIQIVLFGLNYLNNSNICSNSTLEPLT